MSTESQPKYATMTDHELRTAALGLTRALRPGERARILAAFAGELDRARAEVRRARMARERKAGGGRPGVNRLSKRGTSDEHPYRTDATGAFRRADLRADD